MKLIIGSKGSGKTTKLIEEFLKDPKGVLLASDAAAAKRLRQLYNLPARKVYTVSYMQSGNLRGQDINIYFDDLDRYLSGVFSNMNMTCATVTSADVVWGLDEWNIKL